MSDYERHRVEMRKLPIGAKSFMTAKLKEISHYDHEVVDDMDDDDLYENFQDEFYEEFAVSLKNDVVYEITSKEELDAYEDILEVEKTGDVIKVYTQFYNGGTCLSEQLQEAIEK